MRFFHYFHLKQTNCTFTDIPSLIDTNWSRGGGGLIWLLVGLRVLLVHRLIPLVYSSKACRENIVHPWERDWVLSISPLTSFIQRMRSWLLLGRRLHKFTLNDAHRFITSSKKGTQVFNPLRPPRENKEKQINTQVKITL